MRSIGMLPNLSYNPPMVQSNEAMPLPLPQAYDLPRWIDAGCPLLIAVADCQDKRCPGATTKNLGLSFPPVKISSKGISAK